MTREGVLSGALRRPFDVYGGEGDNPRHATWLELFFDLVFVVVLAELGGHLHEDLSVTGFLRFAGLFLLVWWAWLDYSYYADLYEAEDAVSRATMLAVMFVVVFLSQTIDGVFHGESLGFAAAILVLRVTLTGLYLRARQLETPAQAFVATWMGSEVLTTAIWALSLFVPVPGRYGLWGAAFVVNMAGVFIMYTFFDTVLVQVSHFPERLGLITIIVLGETILAVAFGSSIVTSGAGFTIAPLLTGAAGFLVAIGAWWLYFVNFDEDVIDRALNAPHENQLQARQGALFYVFSHYPVHVGIVAAGVGIQVAIEATLHHEALSMGGALALGGVAVFLLGIAICHRAMAGGIDDRVFGARTAAAIAIILLLALGRGLFSPVVLVGGIALVLVALVAFERVDYTMREPEVVPGIEA